MVSDSGATIYSIVGRRERRTLDPWQLDGWSPGYGPPRPRPLRQRAFGHDRRVNRGAIPGLVLIGFGLALFVAAWAHRRRQDR